MKQFERLNDKLTEDVLLVSKLLASQSPGTVLAAQADEDAKALGVAVSLNLARIERDEVPVQRCLLFDADFVTLDDKTTRANT